MGMTSGACGGFHGDFGSSRRACGRRRPRSSRHMYFSSRRSANPFHRLQVERSRYSKLKKVLEIEEQ